MIAVLSDRHSGRRPSEFPHPSKNDDVGRVGTRHPAPMGIPMDIRFWNLADRYNLLHDEQADDVVDEFPRVGVFQSSIENIQVDFR